MALFTSPADHAANPPSSWRVVKMARNRWDVTAADGGIIDSATTKHAAEQLKTDSHLTRLYEQERVWFGGGKVDGWTTSPYATTEGVTR